MYVLILMKTRLGYILGEFFQKLIWSPCLAWRHSSSNPLRLHSNHCLDLLLSPDPLFSSQSMAANVRFRARVVITTIVVAVMNRGSTKLFHDSKLPIHDPPFTTPNPNWRSWILDPGSSILDPRSSILDPRSSILDQQSSISNFWSHLPDPWFFHPEIIAFSKTLLIIL
jgi:hypothetical protein